jgi:uncharacterized membrane protein YhaH (DUF805 family)
MTFTDSIRTCLGKYSTFSGRASRSEFWWFSLIMGLLYLAYALGLPFMFVKSLPSETTKALFFRALLLGAPILLVLLPWAAAGFRRLHDIGWPGWFFLIPLGLTLLSMPLFYLFWFMAGDQAPSSDVQFATAQLLAFAWMVMRWATWPAWIVLAIFLARPGEDAPNRYGQPPMAE